MHFKTRLQLIVLKDGIEALVEINHSMESGDRMDSITNLSIPANYIYEVIFKLNDVIYSVISLGKYVAKNPVIGVRFDTLEIGDKISIQWHDVTGVTERASTTVS